MARCRAHWAAPLHQAIVCCSFWAVLALATSLSRGKATAFFTARISAMTLTAMPASSCLRRCRRSVGRVPRRCRRCMWLHCFSYRAGFDQAERPGLQCERTSLTWATSACPFGSLANALAWGMVALCVTGSGCLLFYIAAAWF